MLPIWISFFQYYEDVTFENIYKFFAFLKQGLYLPSSFFRFLSDFDNVYHFLCIQQIKTFLEILAFCSKWISFSNSNRSSVVSINSFHSTLPFIPFGVLQDSVLGPLFSFIIFLNCPKIIASFFLQSPLLLIDFTTSLHFLTMIVALKLYGVTATITIILFLLYFIVL